MDKNNSFLIQGFKNPFIVADFLTGFGVTMIQNYSRLLNFNISQICIGPYGKFGLQAELRKTQQATTFSTTQTCIRDSRGCWGVRRCCFAFVIMLQGEITIKERGRISLTFAQILL